MDPIVCLIEAEHLIFNTKEYEEAAECLRAYFAWRKAGGFEPQAVTGEKVASMRGDKFARTLRNTLANVEVG